VEDLFLGRGSMPEAAGNPYMFLETLGHDSENHRSYFFDEPEDIALLSPGGNVDVFFSKIEEGLRKGLWAAGYFSYELGYLLEPKLRHLLDSKSPGVPLAWVGLFRTPVTVDHRKDRGRLFEKTNGYAAVTEGGYEIRDLEPNLTRSEYDHAIARIKSHLSDGDTYQVNYTLKYRFALNGRPEALYMGLRDRQTVAYSACLSDGDRTVISLSPELFLKKQGSTLQMKPMKGTARRGRTPGEDEQLARWLATDPKNRAENVMIVDMIRNDLGRIAVPGTVTVPRLFHIERFETLLQMTSTVRANLAAGTSWHEIMRALYPCASVTGTPKIRTMELIAELEREPRGIYTGAIGFIAPEGRACLNVAIRTIVIDADHRGEMGVGSGIVIDSDPPAEYDECVLKAEFLTVEKALLTDSIPNRIIEKVWTRFSLLETMRLENGGIYLLDLHLQRLRSSADEFDVACPVQEIEQQLRDLTARHPVGCFKLRLLLHLDGRFDIVAEALGDMWGTSMRFGISERRIDSGDPFLYHKTTHRPLYDEERRRAFEDGLDDVIFLNERDEITEGTITNVFVEISGILYTPPVTSGLLPGTLRRHLLDTGRCRERILTLDDLKRAEAIYLGNSVRGLVRAVHDATCGVNPT
jgi:para-aminobenzoate synthetase/4-amino-4-deoxychorismate lyase